MNSKNLTTAERNHMQRVKSLPCALCNAPGPSDAHHIDQGSHFTVVALCYECHRGNNGWHGNKAYWRLRKWAELDALNETLRRLAA